MSIDNTQAFLSFTLGGQEYGLDERQVRELCQFDALDRFADGTQVVPGVGRARGVIMPIVDMRAAFAGHPLPYDPNSEVIILTLSHCVMAMVVERVNGVVSLRADQIRAVPCCDGTAPADYLLGLGEVDGRRLILVDIDRLMAIGRHKTDCLV
ncbi:chemotaxis protein CheW [Massilia sp. S19_KUP03_FR1]|uniref:chemotaxis protein CheW n=1 Tax=Massilia sp. S19_KUP03_FR1 TaxID=3025503 RepID=UPI002FCD8595